MKKIFLLFYYLLVVSYVCPAQDNMPEGVKNLVDIADRYGAMESLQLEVVYKAYADTVQNKLVDSSIQRSIFYKGSSFTGHLNTIAIVTPERVFFIDHEKKLAYLDTQYSNHDRDINSQIKDFLAQSQGYSVKELDKGKYRYKIISDSIRFDWVEIDIDIQSKVVNRLAYKYSKENSLRSGVELMVISFRKQLFDEKVDETVFGLGNYVDFSKTKNGELKPPYTNYKFISNLN